MERWIFSRCHGAGRDGGGLGALRRPGAAAAEGGQPGGQGLDDLRRREEVHVGVDAAGGEDLALAGDDVGARPDLQLRVHAVGDVGVAAAAERDDPAVPDADVGPDDAPVVEHDRVGDDRVQRTVGAGGAALGHRLADRLAAAEDRLLAAEGEVLLDLDPQVGVTEPDLVAGRRAVQRGVAPRARSAPSELLLRTAVLIWIPGTRRRPRNATAADRRGTPGLEPDATSRTGCRAGSRARRPGRTPAPVFASGRCRWEPIWIGRSPVLTMTSSIRSASAAVGVELDGARRDPDRAGSDDDAPAIGRSPFSLRSAGGW